MKPSKREHLQWVRALTDANIEDYVNITRDLKCENSPSQNEKLQTCRFHKGESAQGKQNNLGCGCPQQMEASTMHWMVFSIMVIVMKLISNKMGAGQRSDKERRPGTRMWVSEVSKNVF